MAPNIISEKEMLHAGNIPEETLFDYTKAMEKVIAINQNDLKLNIHIQSLRDMVLHLVGKVTRLETELLIHRQKMSHQEEVEPDTGDNL